MPTEVPTTQPQELSLGGSACVSTSPPQELVPGGLALAHCENSQGALEVSTGCHAVLSRGASAVGADAVASPAVFVDQHITIPACSGMPTEVPLGCHAVLPRGASEVPTGRHAVLSRGASAVGADAVALPVAFVDQHFTIPECSGMPTEVPRGGHAVLARGASTFETFHLPVCSGMPTEVPSAAPPLSVGFGGAAHAPCPQRAGEGFSHSAWGAA